MAIALHLSSGCKNVSSASGSISYDVDDKLISASITITFRALPTATTQNALVDAGARQVSPLVWELPKKTKANPSEALYMALKEGAVLQPCQ